MRILVTNDDGIDAPGLGVLARAMRAHGDVVVVAPDSEYSGSGAAIGPVHLFGGAMDPQIHTGHVPGIEESWAVAGAPALCVLLAHLGAFGDIDYVASGINPGANVGRSVYHSGTIGAALTGRNGGLPGVAVSQVVPGFGVEGQSLEEVLDAQSWHSAAQVASAVVGALVSVGQNSAKQNSTASNETQEVGVPVINLNVPNCEIAEMAGWRYTAVGARPVRAITSVSLEPHPANSEAFRVNMEWGDAIDAPAEVDVGAVMHDYVSVSFLSHLHAVGFERTEESLRAPMDAVTQALDELFATGKPALV